MATVVEIMDDLERFTKKRVTELARTVHQELTMNNPVDTGWSRSNWLVSVGGESPRLIGTKASVDHEAGRRSLRVVNLWTPKKGSIYITNNVPYVPILNATHPSAAGFVDAAIARANAMLGFGGD